MDGITNGRKRSAGRLAWYRGLENPGLSECKLKSYLITSKHYDLEAPCFLIYMFMNKSERVEDFNRAINHYYTHLLEATAEDDFGHA